MRAPRPAHVAFAVVLAGGCDGSSALLDAAADASSDAAMCEPTSPRSDPTAAMRAACAFDAGARVADTLGLGETWRASLPITHVVIVMQENRSFDHYFGQLANSTQPLAEPIPATYTNPDATGAANRPFHLWSPCLAADPGHQWASMHAAWNLGAMDGFVRNAAASTGQDGRFAIGYYDASDLPFYYWLAGTFAIADHYFASALSGTWPNRDYLYAGNSYGVHSTGEATIDGRATVFDQLDAAGVTWGVFTDGTPRQDCLGWTAAHPGVHPFASLLRGLSDGSLPRVAFVDPSGLVDEHPPNDIQHGEAWSRSIYQAAVASPLWMQLAVFFTYDEGGGLFDHVPPPTACLAAPDQTDFDRLGMRVPMIAVSPWSRRAFVSHAVHEHASLLRFVEALFDLPALTARDANADALLDMFDFGCASSMHPPAAPIAGAAPACP